MIQTRQNGGDVYVRGYDKIPMYFNPERRYALTQVPSDLSDRDVARYSTFTEKGRELINS